MMNGELKHEDGWSGEEVGNSGDIYRKNVIYDR